MKTLFLFHINVVIIFLYVGVVQPAMATDNFITIAFFQPDTTANPVEGNAAMKWWGDLISKQINIKIVTRFFITMKDFEDYMAAHKVEIAILNPLYIIENYQKRNIVPVITAIRDGKQYYNRALIVLKNKNVEKVEDLKDGTLITTRLGGRIIEFIENVEFQGKIQIKKLFKNVILETNPRICLSRLCEQEADAALIPLTNYEILLELIPKMKEETRILMVSQKIPLAAGCYFADVTSKSKVQPIFDAALDIHKTPQGQQAMLIFKADRWDLTSLNVYKPFLKKLKKSVPP